MSRVCEISGKRSATANNVSHAMNRTKRWQLPNLHEKSLHSDILNQKVSMRITTHAMRTIDKYGNLDSFMLNVKNRNTESFSPAMKRVRKLIIKKATATQEASAE